jgi:hypothetical protein
MAVALIALFISLGGVSYGFATGSVDTREIKNNTIRTRDLRNGEVRGRDIRNSTVRGRDVALNTLGGLDIDESKLGPVPVAGLAGQALRPVAYARVDSTGNVDDTTTYGGIADQHVAKSSAGHYCIRGVRFAFQTAQVTIDYGDPVTGGRNDLVASVAKGDPKGECEGGASLVVATSDVDEPNATTSPAGFYIWFFN